MKTFTLYRRNREAVVAAHETDIASVDGAEPTLEGVVFSDGKVVVRWLTPDRSTVIWDSFEAFERVHVSNHPTYGTEIVWSESETPTPITRFCTTMGHEDVPAVGRAWVWADENTELVGDYCGECLDVLERGGDHVHRWLVGGGLMP